MCTKEIFRKQKVSATESSDREAEINNFPLIQFCSVMVSVPVHLLKDLSSSLHSPASKHHQQQAWTSTESELQDFQPVCLGLSLPKICLCGLSRPAACFPPFFIPSRWKTVIFRLDIHGRCYGKRPASVFVPQENYHPHANFGFNCK